MSQNNQFQFFKEINLETILEISDWWPCMCYIRKLLPVWCLKVRLCWIFCLFWPEKNVVCLLLWYLALTECKFPHGEERICPSKLMCVPSGRCPLMPYYPLAPLLWETTTTAYPCQIFCRFRKTFLAVWVAFSADITIFFSSWEKAEVSQELDLAF